VTHLNQSFYGTKEALHWSSALTAAGAIAEPAPSSNHGQFILQHARGSFKSHLTMRQATSQ
jgi:hypothetical protein